MPIVTSLETQRHDPERVNVYLDGSFGFGASKMLVFARGLHVGQHLNHEIVDELVRDDTVEKAHAAALNFLSYRPRSTRELREYFRRKGSEDEVVEAVIERLQRAGLLNDREFARYWVQNRMAFRPRGTRALRVEMRRKGLEGEVIDEALENVGDEEEAAYAAGLKKVRELRDLDEREFFRKMVELLKRRGFPWEVASRAAKRLNDGRAPEETVE
jgi:regulatory protein